MVTHFVSSTHEEDQVGSRKSNNIIYWPQARRLGKLLAETRETESKLHRRAFQGIDPSHRQGLADIMPVQSFQDGSLSNSFLTKDP